MDCRNASPHERAEVSKLDGPAADAARQDLRSQAAAAASEPLKLLDQLEEADRRLLSIDEAIALENTDLSWEAVQERMRLLDRPQTEFVTTLQEMARGAPSPAHPLISPRRRRPAFTPAPMHSSSACAAGCASLTAQNAST